MVHAQVLCLTRRPHLCPYRRKKGLQRGIAVTHHLGLHLLRDLVLLRRILQGALQHMPLNLPEPGGVSRWCCVVIDVVNCSAPSRTLDMIRCPLHQCLTVIDKDLIKLQLIPTLCRYRVCRGRLEEPRQAEHMIS